MAHLSVSQAARTSTVDITADGTIDWIRALSSGPDTFNRKSGGGSLFSVLSYSPDTHGYNSGIGANAISWSDGATSGSGSDSSGMYNYGNITLTVPASATAQRARVYAGVSGTLTLTCTVSLSDASVPDANVAYSGSTDCTFDIEFAAGSGGQTLTISLTRSNSDYQYFSGASLTTGTAPSGKPGYYYGSM